MQLSLPIYSRKCLLTELDYRYLPLQLGHINGVDAREPDSRRLSGRGAVQEFRYDELTSLHFGADSLLGHGQSSDGHNNYTLLSRDDEHGVRRHGQL